MSDAQRVLLVGATGLVGRRVISHGRGRPEISLVALARREMQLPRGGRMELVLAPVQDWARIIALIAPDAVICALGTTQARSGKDGLAAVDRDLVLAVADSARKVGTRRFVHCSSAGANPAARAYYMAIKGQAEEGLRAVGFERLDILRPGLLRGQRWNDHRRLEAVGQALSPLANLVLHGSLRRFRSIAARDVALAALQGTREPGHGVFVQEHDSLVRLAGCWQHRTGDKGEQG